MGIVDRNEVQRPSKRFRPLRDSKSFRTRGKSLCCHRCVLHQVNYVVTKKKEKVVFNRQSQEILYINLLKNVNVCYRIFFCFVS